MAKAGPQQRGRLRRGRVRQLRRRDRRPAGPVRGERDRARGGQERRAVPGEEARHDRPDARGARRSRRRVDWGFYSTPQKHLLDRKMPVPRGKVVGGSSSINGMVYVRGNRANYDSWAAEGNTGWDADEVNAAYKRMEDFEDGENDYRGAGGPIRITRNKTPQEGIAAVHPGDRRHPRRQGPRRLQRRVAGGRQPDAAERRRRPALQRLARLHPPPRRRRRCSCRPRCWSPGSSSRTAAPPASRSPTRTGRRRHRPRRQGGHPLGRLRRLGAAPDALRHRPRPAPARPRHRRASRTCRSATTCTTTCSTR